MALTKIKEIVCLLELDWTGRKKLDDGLVRIGSVDGRDDLTGRVTDELHRCVDAGIACWNSAGFWYLSGWLCWAGFVGLVWFFGHGEVISSDNMKYFN